MALIRGHHAFDDHFTQIPNDWVRDERLSLEARGLLAQIMSHRPGWNLSIKSLAARNSIGRDKVKRIMDELLTHGYLKRSETQSHNERGHLAGYDYTTCDPGVTQEPCKAEPDKAEPAKAVKPPKKNMPIEQHLEKKNIDIESDFNDFWNIYPRKQGKGKAKEAFMKAIKNGASVLAVLEGARRYAADPNLPDPQFIPMPTTWLNQERWEDGPLPLNRKLTNSERNLLNFANKMTTTNQKEVESGQESSASIASFGINLRSADSV
jgi:hypothetical protein